MKKTLCILATGLLAAELANATLVVNTQVGGTGASAAFPATFTPVGTTDLANADQSTFLSIVGSGLLAGSAADLVNGSVPGVANDMSNRAAINNASTITISFNTTVNTYGYDITGINTYAGWDSSGSGRANQDYTLTVTFVDNTTATLYTATAGDTTGLEPNNMTNSWTAVYLTDSTGTMASGVKSITFSSFDDYKTGTTAIQYREFDVFGTASIPEPAALGLVAVCAGGIFFVRRRFML